MQGIQTIYSDKIHLKIVSPVNVTTALYLRQISLEIHKAMFVSVLRVMSSNQLYQLTVSDKYRVIQEESALLWEMIV